MHENISIAQIQATLQDVAIHLKSASGNDAFISQSDLEKLFPTLYATDTERAQLLSALYAIAAITESAEGGRITRKDIDRAVQVVVQKVMPEYRLVPGPLSAAAESALMLLGVDYVTMARHLKTYVNKLHTLPANELALQLQALTSNLYFNTFHQNDTGILVDSVPFGAPILSGASFLLALETSGNPNWEGVRQSVGAENENPGTDIQDFWATFPTLQNEGPDRERALATDRLWHMHLSQSKFLRFDNPAFESTHFFVAGVNGRSELVFMMLRYLWT